MVLHKLPVPAVWPNRSFNLNILIRTVLFQFEPLPLGRIKITHELNSIDIKTVDLGLLRIKYCYRPLVHITTAFTCIEIA